MKTIESLAVHASDTPDEFGAVVPPLYTSTTFRQAAPGEPGPYEYARMANPTRAMLEKTVATLENGAHGFAFATGLAACSTVLDLLDKDAHVIAVDDLYGGTRRLLEKVRQRTTGLTVSYIDPADLAGIEAAVCANTKMIWVETPTNPLMKMADLSAIAAIAKRHDLISVVDNTFATPCLQRPIEHGFDVVLHSATKYLNGHSDVVAGVVVTSAEATAVSERLAFLQNAVGSVLDPYSSFMTVRGIKTLAIRMERHSENALKIARWLEAQPGIKAVHYPGLESHPQHALAQRQMSAFGGMISAELNGDNDYVRRVVARLRIFTLAESLGGVESLICQPSVMTHAAMSPEQQREVGITPQLLRLSVGIENADELIADLEQAFAE